MREARAPSVSTGPGAPKPLGHSSLIHPEQRQEGTKITVPKHTDHGTLGSLEVGWTLQIQAQGMCLIVSGQQGTCKPFTCQAAVHHVVFPPKPENSLVWGFHRIHGLLSHFFKMLSTFFAPKECMNVSPYGLQHSLGVIFKPWRRKKAVSAANLQIMKPWTCQMAQTRKDSGSIQDRGLLQVSPQRRTHGMVPQIPYCNWKWKAAPTA